MIGLAAAFAWTLYGRIAGISGILGNLWRARGIDLDWRTAFISGLAFAGLVAGLFHPSSFASEAVISTPRLMLAGLLVGFGTRLGNGCTSGHGVCGMARFSPRSIAATLTFVSVGMLTVTLVGGVQ